MPEGRDATVYASGFTHIIDIVFGRDGSLYVLQIAKNGLLGAFGPPFHWTGALIKVDATERELSWLAGALVAPGGIAIGLDGHTLCHEPEHLRRRRRGARIRPYG